MTNIGPHTKGDSYPWHYVIVSTVGKGCFYTGLRSPGYSTQTWSLSPSAAAWYEYMPEATRAMFDLFACRTRGVPARSLRLLKMPSVIREFTYRLSVVNDQEIVEVSVRRPSFNRMFKKTPELLTELLNNLMHVNNRTYKYSPSIGLVMPKPFSAN